MALFYTSRCTNGQQKSNTSHGQPDSYHTFWCYSTEGEERSLHLQDYTMQEMLDDLKVDHPTKELRHIAS